MPWRVLRRLQFALERWVVRGPQYRLLFVAALIALVSAGAGLLVYWAGAGFSRPAEAIWWAFLRLTDPGYLGDDQGVLLRTVSTVVTVTGYVLFLGALVAIMTQWFHARMRTLELGITPIAQNGHLVVLGLTDRTGTVLVELLRTETQVKRRRLRVAVLGEELDAARAYDLRDRVGAHWDGGRIILRSGSALRLEHLQRVDFEHASAIIVPANEYIEGGPDASDTRTIKTLLSIANSAPEDPGQDFPLVVAELFDPRRVPVAYGAHGGALEIVSSNLVVGRLLAQTVRHPGLSHVYGEILAHGDGNRIYVREHPELVGSSLRSLSHAFPRAVVLGLVRPETNGFRPVLDPSQDVVVQEGDRFALLAESYSASAADDAFVPPDAPPPRLESAPVHEARWRRVLVLGWSHRVPQLLRELDDSERERLEVTLATAVPTSDREAELVHYDFRPRHLSVRHEAIDYTVPADLARVKPASYDQIVMVSNDRLISGEEADARTILGHVLLRRELQGVRSPPRVLVELTDPSNRELLHGSSTEVMVSALAVSHMLAQVALRRELSDVFDELFGSGGADIAFRPVADYGLAGAMVRFVDLRDAATQRGEVALGIRRGHLAAYNGGVVLNPPSEQRWKLGAEDEVVVLTAD